MRNVFSVLIAGAISALAITAAPAHAVEKGLCLPNQEMVVRLRSEGQRAVFNGDAVLVDGAHTDPMLSAIYTTNSVGSVGYVITGQRGTNQAAPAILCVGEVLTNLRLANPTYRRVPVSFYAPNGLSKEEAERIGDREGIANPGSLNVTMDHAAVNSLGVPVLQAELAEPAGRWKMVTVILTPGRGAVTYDSAERGLQTMRYALLHAELTPYAQGLLGEGSIWGGGR